MAGQVLCGRGARGLPWGPSLYPPGRPHRSPAAPCGSGRRRRRACEAGPGSAEAPRQVRAWPRLREWCRAGPGPGPRWRLALSGWGRRRRRQRRRRRRGSPPFHRPTERTRAPHPPRLLSELGPRGWGSQNEFRWLFPPLEREPVMILPQVHLRKPCYDFYFL